MIDQIKLRIHSVVDVITNSSTVIYTNCDDNCLQNARDLVNTILKEAGSDKTADDLYTFKIALTEDAIHQLYYNEDFIEKSGYKKQPSDLGWRENVYHLSKFLDDNNITYEDVKEFLDSDEDYNSNTVIIITTKDGKTSNFTDMILSTVNQDAARNG